MFGNESDGSLCSTCSGSTDLSGDELGKKHKGRRRRDHMLPTRDAMSDVYSGKHKEFSSEEEAEVNRPKNDFSTVDFNKIFKEKENDENKLEQNCDDAFLQSGVPPLEEFDEFSDDKHVSNNELITQISEIIPSEDESKIVENDKFKVQQINGNNKETCSENIETKVNEKQELSTIPEPNTTTPLHSMLNFVDSDTLKSTETEFLENRTLKNNNCAVIDLTVKNENLEIEENQSIYTISKNENNPQKHSNVSDLLNIIENTSEDSKNTSNLTDELNLFSEMNTTLRKPLIVEIDCPLPEEEAKWNLHSSLLDKSEKAAMSNNKSTEYNQTTIYSTPEISDENLDKCNEGADSLEKLGLKETENSNLQDIPGSQTQSMTFNRKNYEQKKQIVEETQIKMMKVSTEIREHITQPKTLLGNEDRKNEKSEKIQESSITTGEMFKEQKIIMGGPEIQTKLASSENEQETQIVDSTLIKTDIFPEQNNEQNSTTVKGDTHLQLAPHLEVQGKHEKQETFIDSKIHDYGDRGITSFPKNMLRREIESTSDKEDILDLTLENEHCNPINLLANNSTEFSHNSTGLNNEKEILTTTVSDKEFEDNFNDIEFYFLNSKNTEQNVKSNENSGYIEYKAFENILHTNKPDIAKINNQTPSKEKLQPLNAAVEIKKLQKGVSECAVPQNLKESFERKLIQNEYKLSFAEKIYNESNESRMPNLAEMLIPKKEETITNYQSTDVKATVTFGETIRKPLSSVYKLQDVDEDKILIGYSGPSSFDQKLVKKNHSYVQNKVLKLSEKTEGNVDNENFQKIPSDNPALDEVNRLFPVNKNLRKNILKPCTYEIGELEMDLEHMPPILSPVTICISDESASETECDIELISNNYIIPDIENCNISFQKVEQDACEKTTNILPEKEMELEIEMENNDELKSLEIEEFNEYQSVMQAFDPLRERTEEELEELCNTAIEYDSDDPGDPNSFVPVDKCVQCIPVKAPKEILLPADDE